MTRQVITDSKEPVSQEYVDQGNRVMKILADCFDMNEISQFLAVNAMSSMIVALLSETEKPFENLEDLFNLMTRAMEAHTNERKDP